jgi:hypothetical protein
MVSNLTAFFYKGRNFRHKHHRRLYKLDIFDTWHLIIFYIFSRTFINENKITIIYGL